MTTEVYSINTTTLGVTSYHGSILDAANAVMAYADIAYAVHADGLYELSGDDDDGAAIAAILETGLAAFGVPENYKYCHRVQLYGEAEGGAKITVKERRDGIDSEYPYITTDFGGSESRSHFVRPGKSIHGEALGVRIENVNGGSFKVKRLSVDTPLGRLA